MEEQMRLQRKILILLAVTALMISLAISPGQTGVALAQTAATVTYNLYATDGFITLADGTVAYIYGFVGGRQGVPLTIQNSAKAKVAPGGITNLLGGAPGPTGGLMTAAETPLFGNAQFPAPVIYARTTDIVQINLKNLGVANGAAPNDPHTIHLHGLDVDAANDGVPETSVAAVPANAAKTPGAGNIVVYMFSPSKPGTYMYHCHQEASIHVQMGMYGALVVYNPGDAAATNGPTTGGGILHGWEYTKDVVLLLSEFDLGQHLAEQNAGARGAYNPVNYKPQYWFINGLSFPNTIHAGLPPFNWANWIASHPGYDPFIVGSVGKAGPADKVLLRVINMGFEAQPMHMHGYHAKIIGSDQRAWPWANTAGLTPSGEGLEKNTLLIGSGETYEWLIDMGQQSLNANYYVDPNTGLTSQTRYNPVSLAPLNNNDVTKPPAIPDPFAPGFAYVGGPVVGPDGNQGTGGLPAELGIVQGQFFPFHNHDDYKATNNGVYPGGMFTMILTTP
jgi:manganese oxidase